MAYNAEQPSFHILICLIEIWKLNDKKPKELLMPSGKPDIMIAEVESLEIRESYRDVVGSANIKFPRGTVIKKTVEANQIDNPKYTVTAEITSQGAIVEKRTNTDVANPSDFSVGSRIRISLGYTEDTQVANLTRVSSGNPTIFTDDEKYNEYKRHLTTMFEGYITKCSIDSPIELECEDLAHLLKCVTCKKTTTSNKSKVKDLMYRTDNKGTHGLLAETGLKLHPKSEDILIGKCSITPDFTAFDILNSWHKWKIYAFLAWDENGEPCIAVRDTYFHGGQNSLIGENREVKASIDFGYNVADNNLTLVDTNNMSLAVQASSKDTDGKKTTTLTLMARPEWEEGDPEKDRWRVVNETKISSKAMKKHHIKMVAEDAFNIRLSEYTVIEYQSRKIGLTHQQLMEEAIAFYEGYKVNGIEGSLTLFGDLKIHTTDIVELKDNRFPMKNGKYLVEEVVTKFGVNGYRQTIKIPYCLQREAQNRQNSNEQQ